MSPLNVSAPTFNMTTLIPSKLTDEVVSRYEDCPDPRLKEIMISLVKHFHSFARCRRN